MTVEHGGANQSARHLTTALWAIAGLGVLSSAVLRWVDSGPGSRFGGLELADNIRSGVLSPSWGVWVALGLYSVIGFGGVMIGTAVVDRLVVIVLRGVVCLIATLSFGAIAANAIPLTDWAAGSTVAALSFAVGSILTIAQLVLRLRTP